MKFFTCVIFLYLYAATSIFCQSNDIIDWKTDLEYLKTQLPELHSNLFSKITKEEYNDEIDQLIHVSEKISSDAMFIKIEQLIAKVGDSHTGTNYTSKITKKYLPMVLYQYEEGIFIVGASEDEKEILGNKIIGFNGFALSRIIDSLKTVFVAENESIINARIPGLLVNYTLLNHFGFATNEKITVQSENYYGIPTEFKIKPVSTNDSDEIDFNFVRFSSKKIKRPSTRAIFSHKYINQDSTLYILYNKCTGREDQQMSVIADSMQLSHSCLNSSNTAAKPLPYFRNFRDSVLVTIRSKPLKKLVIDLSRNTGGNPSQGTRMFEKIAELTKSNNDLKVYVIVGRSTFSAGIIHALELKRLFNATIIGEPTAGKPNFYGGIDSRYLPGSCLRVTFSRYYRSMIKEMSDQEPSTLIPDVIFPLKFQDVVSGHDPVYHWILQQK